MIQRKQSDDLKLLLAKMLLWIVTYGCFCTARMTSLAVAQPRSKSFCHGKNQVSLVPSVPRAGSTGSTRFNTVSSRSIAKRGDSSWTGKSSSNQDLSVIPHDDNYGIDQRRRYSEGKEAMDSFLTRQSRNTFISRVYAILGMQLLVTSFSIFLFGTNNWGYSLLRIGREWGAAVPGLSLLISSFAHVIMCSSETARRASPLKWQLLTLFTLGEAISVGFISSFFRFRSVVTAMLATGGTTCAVSLYTLLNRNSNYDLSQWGAGLSSAATIFLVLGLVQLLEVTGVLPKGFLPFNDTVYCFLGATLFSFYLAYHTKLIVAGNHSKYQMSDKDYVFGAMLLFNDIINIFIYILDLLGEERD